MKRSPIKRKRKKVDPQVVGVQAGWCRDQPCLVCGNRWRTEAHHVRTKGAGGKDSDCVPLCPYHHDKVHTMGRKTFEEEFLVDLTREAEKAAENVAGGFPFTPYESDRHPRRGGKYCNSDNDIQWRV